MKSHRLARVNEVVREVAANAVLFEIKDPRVKGVTVTRAEVSADLQHAKVFVSVMGSEKEQQLTMHGLKSAAAFVQTKVAAQLTTRYVPHITFVLDEGVKKSVEIARMIREENERLAADRAARGEADPDHDAPEARSEAEGLSPADGPPEDAEQPGPADGPATHPD
jgi:ribosome-binding factor A